MQVTAENVVRRTNVITAMSRVEFGAVNFHLACLAEKATFANPTHYLCSYPSRLSTPHSTYSLKHSHDFNNTTLRTPPFNVLIETLPHACFLCAVFFKILVSAVIVSKYGQRQVLSSPIQSDSLTPFGQTIPRNAMQQQSAAAFFDCHLSSARLRLRFPSRNDSIEG